MDVEPYQLNDVIRHTATLVRLEELEGHARGAEASRSVRVRRVYILYAPFAQALYPFKSRGFGGEIELVPGKAKGMQFCPPNRDFENR